MSAKRLSNVIRDKIIASLRKDIEAKYDTGPAAQELAELFRATVAIITQEAEALATPEEIAVLKKFGRCETIRTLVLSWGPRYFKQPEEVMGYGNLLYPGNVPAGGFGVKGSKAVIVLRRPVLAPDYATGNPVEKIIAAINADPEKQAAVRAFIEGAQLRDCEVGKIEAAYRKVLQGYRTVASLVKDYPEITPHIPAESAPAKPLPVSDAEKLIATFLQDMQPT